MNLFRKRETKPTREERFAQAQMQFDAAQDMFVQAQMQIDESDEQLEVIIEESEQEIMKLQHMVSNAKNGKARNQKLKVKLKEFTDI